LQILGTLDKPTVESGIELRINNEDILTMNDKTLSKFRNLNLGLYFNFISCSLIYLSKTCVSPFIANKSRRRRVGKIINVSWSFAPYESNAQELSGGEQLALCWQALELGNADAIGRKAVR
jgi:lipoprotein-releasing system ATP-binding protein